MGVHKYQYNWNFFTTPSEELYYFLGFIAADGYITDDLIEIGINEKDVALLTTFQNLIVPDKPLYYKASLSAYVLKINYRHGMQEIKNFYNMRTNNKHDEIKFPTIPTPYIKDFIRGYIDGDGCIDTAKGYKKDKIYIGPRLRILGNKEFLEGLNNATKLFVKHNTNAISRKGKENIYTVTYNFSTASNLLVWLYNQSTIYLERKKLKAQVVTNITLQ